MQEIDKPFRFSWDFCLIQALLFVPTFVFANNIDVGPWYSICAFLIVVPMLATFAIYGPVLLARQIIRSGSRGWFVARVLISIVFVAALLFGGFLISGFYTETRAQLLGFAFAGTATVYLNWKVSRAAHRT